MNFITVPNGTEIALSVPDSSDSDGKQALPVKTTGDLLAIMEKNPPRSVKMLRTTCGHLGKYFDLPGDQIPFDLIEDQKRGFRPFLESRRYSENSVRTYVNHQRALMKMAMRHGWDPDGHPTEAWKPLLEIAREERLTDIVRHFARTLKSPKDVTKEAVDDWAEARVRDNIMYSTVGGKKYQFWRLLQKTGWVTSTPAHMLKFEQYGIALDDLNPGLRRDIQTILKWKQAAFAVNRPKKGRIRAVTATGLRLIISQLAGYVVNICGGSPESLKELAQKPLVEGFIEWAINERHIAGRSIQPRLGSLAAALKYHPAYAEIDFTWFKPLLDSIPLEDISERKKRKAAKFVGYDELETIPDQIRAFRAAYEKKRKTSQTRVAQLAMEEFMFRWFLVLPWRQRNLRECRIEGSAPNLFKGKIPTLSDIDKPGWVIEEQSRNPDAEFWMVSFTPDGTKTHIAIDLLLPRQLVDPLEEYLSQFRPLLLGNQTPETLFVSAHGKPMRSDHIEKVIGHWTTKFASARTTPHVIRDSVAFKWLKEHPADYLTLSKILWHKNPTMVFLTYGARFNESSGSCAMEAWLDKRPAHQN
jgi:integrase